MLGLALLPTLSRAMNPTTGTGPWSEICSTAGARWLDTAAPRNVADATGAPATPDTTRTAHMEHCPLCAQFSPVLGLPPSEPAAMPVADGADHLPALYTQAPRPLFAWAPVQARAPPLL